MHPCLGNWMAIGHVDVYYTEAVHAFSAGIKCRHCSLCTDSPVNIRQKWSSLELIATEGFWCQMLY